MEAVHCKYTISFIVWISKSTVRGVLFANCKPISKNKDGQKNACNIFLCWVALSRLPSRITTMPTQCILSVPPGRSTSSIPLWRGVLQPWPCAGPLIPAHCFPADQSHRPRRELLRLWSPWWPVWEREEQGRSGCRPQHPTMNMSSWLTTPLHVTTTDVQGTYWTIR